MLKTHITKQDNGKLAQIRRIARQFNGGVYVGYFSDQGNHASKQKGKPPITLGSLASIHEQGAKYISARPFVLPALEKNRQRYLRTLKTHITPVLQGRLPLVAVWQTIGQHATGDVQHYMLTASFKPLAPATIKRKGSSKPLIDSGQLRKSVTYKVK